MKKILFFFFILYLAVITSFAQNKSNVSSPVQLKSLKDYAAQKYPDVFKAKDEFETDAEYRARLDQQKSILVKLRVEFKDEIARMKEQKEREAAEQAAAAKRELERKIADSRKPVTLSLQSIGTYDANSETFPIVVDGNNYTITIPRSEARSFKENNTSVRIEGVKQLKENLTDFEYINLSASHPVTGNRYSFGTQKELAGFASTSGSAAKTITPPSLSLEVSFSEANGNRYLDAEETGKISVKIKNSGKGSAVGVKVTLKPEGSTSDLTYSPSRTVGEVPAGSAREIDFEISANQKVDQKNVRFLVEVAESNGFPPDPARISFDTYPYQYPALALVDFGVNTANNDNIIKPGIETYIKFRIQNKGAGKALSPSFSVSLPSGVFFSSGSKERFSSTELKPGEFADYEFTIVPSKNVEKEININIGYSEKTGSGSFPLKLAIEKPLASINEFTVKGEEIKTATIETATGLSVDIENNIPETKIQNQNAIALIIRVSEYQNKNVPKLKFARRDAAVMRQYLEKSLGYNRKNIFPQNEDELMTVGTMKTYVKNKLPSFLKPDGSSELFIYYVGHGAPSTTEQEAYLVPFDCDPNYVTKENAYPINEFYEDISKLKASKKIVVLDACFSGQAGDGSMLINNASPIFIKVGATAKLGGNTALFQSSEAQQVSNWYPEKQHSMFTYFFLKGLQGAADKNNDGQITASELKSYINDENDGLPYISNREFQRPQRAVITGNEEMVIR